MSLRVENLSFGYYVGRPVLRALNLEIQTGQVTGLFGPNGSGKSTLLRCLNGALRPQSGGVFLDGQPILQQSLREVAARIAVVPQETPFNMPFTVFEMVMLGRFAHWDFWGHQSPEDIRVVNASLERVSALDLADRHFEQLSGGERQRVVIARALAQETRVLLLDEPASHLDITHQLEVFHLSRSLAAEGYTVLMVCHDLLIAPMFTDHAVLMNGGQIFATGAPAAVFTPDNLACVFGLELTLQWPASGTVIASC